MLRSALSVTNTAGAGQDSFFLILDVHSCCARCGRFIIDDLVTLKEAHGLLALAKKGLAQVLGSAVQV